MEKNYFIIVFLLIVIFTVYSQDNQEDTYYNQILNATFIDDKNIIAVKLGKLKTEKAKELLLKLFEDKSSWNRAGVIEGLLVLNEPLIDNIMIDKYFTDSMIESYMNKSIYKNFIRFYKIISDKYDSSTDQKISEKAIKLISNSKTFEGENFLKKVISDTNSKNRKLAFEEFFKNYKENSYAFAKNYINEEELKEYALSCILVSGTRDDLPVFLKIIENKENSKYIIISYEAVKKWGDEQLMQKIYLESLKQDDENLIQSGLYLFNEIQSNEIKEELCRLIKAAKYQNVRLSSAENLLKYNKKDIIPMIIPILNEAYISNDTFGGGDILASIFTLGLSGLFDKYNKKKTKDSFNSRIKQIELSLSKLTGVNPGSGYEQWLDWAIYNGYTVNGTNIIQYLFSGYPQKRLKAIQSAYALLGFKTDRDFYKDNPKFKDYSNKDFIIELAKLLIDKGYLTDAKY